MSSDTVPRWPRIDAIVRDDGSGEVTIDGTFHPITASNLEEARVEVLRRVTENAAQIGRPVRASATGPEGLWNLIVHPDGTVVPEEDFDEPAHGEPTTAGFADPAGTLAGGVESDPEDTVRRVPRAPDAPGTSEPSIDRAPSPADRAGGAAPGPVAGGFAEPGYGASGGAPAGTPSSFAAPTDAAPTHAAPTGAAPSDTGTPEGLPGAGLPDAGLPDAGLPDAADEGTPPRADVSPAGPSYAAPDYTSTNARSSNGHGSSTPATNGTGVGSTDSAGSTGAVGSTDGADAQGWARDSLDDTRIRPTGGPTGGAYPVSGPVDSVPAADPVPAGGGVGPEGGASASSSGAMPAQDPEAPRSRREARQSFLTHQQDEDPATRGVRGLLTRVGIRVGPNEAERAERADERAVSQHWPGPRTISIVNGKGGAGKTPSTVLLAAVFAQFGGAGVVTWDNNQTRGTLGWRTEQGPHESTLLDLLPQTDRLLGPSAQAADLARYVHHQTRDRFDVLRSKPIAMANEQRIEPQDVDAIHSVLSKYYRMILIDSGNDESDPMWQRMIDRTDQLVVATTTRDDHAEAGALLLEALATRDGRSAYLAQQAVVVVSQADQKEPASELEKVADAYRALAREVVTIPFDPAMVDGHLRYGALRPDTRRAWLSAGAAVAGGL